MKIMLCGSSDIEPFLETFKKVVFNFEGDPFCFIDSSIVFSNFSTWGKNSTETVRESDLIVFLIIEKYGAITWQTEYKIAKQEGKPFLLFCLDNTYQKYISSGLNSQIEESLQKTIELLL